MASPVASGSAGASRSYGVERLGALSDGVFAIALTLLVLELKIPEVPPGEVQVLRHDLIALLPNVVAWLVSFGLLARYWTIQHDVLASLQECHVGTIAVNFVVLAFASLVPFASALIGTYEFEVLPVAIFSGTIAATGMAIGFFARHVKMHPARLRGREPHLHWHWRYNAFVVPLFAVMAVGLSLAAHPIIALGAWIIEPIVALALLHRRH